MSEWDIQVQHGPGSPMIYDVDGYQQASVSLTATWTSTLMWVGGYLPAGAEVFWDDLTLTQDAWSEPGPTVTVTDAVVRSQSGGQRSGTTWPTGTCPRP